MSLLKLFEELKVIAQSGLSYSENQYDLVRYNRILKLVSEEYSKSLEMPSGEILKKLKDDIIKKSPISPKVALVGAVFDEGGKILLIQRADNSLWSLPAGLAEIHESPSEGVEREVMEETGFLVKARKVLDVCVRFSGQYSQPFTSYNILYSCEIIGGFNNPCELEVLKCDFFDIDEVAGWYKDHKKYARIAFSHTH